MTATVGVSPLVVSRPDPRLDESYQLPCSKKKVAQATAVGHNCCGLSTLPFVWILQQVRFVLPFFSSKYFVETSIYSAFRLSP